MLVVAVLRGVGVAGAPGIHVKLGAVLALPGLQTDSSVAPGPDLVLAQGAEGAALEGAGFPVLQPAEALGFDRRVLHPGMVLQHNSRAAYVLHMNAYVPRMHSYAARDILLPSAPVKLIQDNKLSILTVLFISK